MYKQKTEEEKSKIGDYVYIKLSVRNIARNCICLENKSFGGRMDYFKKVRELCKELMEEKEYANA